MLEYMYSILLMLNLFFILTGNHRVKNIINDKENEILLLQKENKKLSEENTNKLNETINIINLNLKLEDEIRFLRKSIEENNKLDTLVPLIKNEFGSGLIRVCENGVYYHGVCKEETQKWNNNNRCSRQIYEYKIKNNNLHNLDKYNTFNIDEFCNNCLLIKDKKKYKIFECQGHQY